MRNLILLLAFLPMAQATNICPWMNAATASGLLGGEVVATSAISKSQDSGNCEFVRISNGAAKLRIEVAIMKSPGSDFAAYLGKCASHSKPLKAIGNEAVTCSVPQNGARVVGRVRNQAFVITLSPAGEDDSIRKAAEIVAGNLF
jgi:hypothetical protein